mmetsp:Transcript_27172/g.24051  ORF Transcript_27172/g.24051 Transcript_27172/m.24051 type:complete len:161 (-) Transcript_27172:469-951(-)
MFRKHPLMKDKYIRIIMPVLITYLKWFEDTDQLDTILATIETDDGDKEGPVLKISGQNNNKDVTISILWALSFLPERKICRLCMTDEPLMLLVLKCYSNSSNPYLRLPALRFLGNICTDDDILAKKLLVDYNIMEPMKETIQDRKTFMRKETCWVASNIV